jgi:hypothetical protein
MDSSVSPERRNLVSARVPSHFNWPLPVTWSLMAVINPIVPGKCSPCVRRNFIDVWCFKVIWGAFRVGYCSSTLLFFRASSRCFHFCRDTQGSCSQPISVAALSAAARLLGLRVRIPPGAWMSLCCECCVFSGRGCCDRPIRRPEESYRMWCVWVWWWSLYK